VFLPWVRQGAAAGIETPDMSLKQAGVVSVRVGLRINGTDDIVRQVRLYGPGDVTGIDPQQVVRTEPRHLSMGFEPNYFPAIEFDRPDFPWLFTPAKEDARGRLRPWICLIVVRKQKGVVLHSDGDLPVLEIKDPARPWEELPDLSESWAWAHAQVTGSQSESEKLQVSLEGDPALTASRLLCPRRLDAETDYLACVVPAFELGVKAGLGLPFLSTDEERLEPAWRVSRNTPGTPRTAKVPVYFHWEFRTGAGNDFESLAGLLQARKIPKDAGKRRIDISQAGFRITPPLPSGTILELEGALRVPDASTAEWPEATRMPFQIHLKKILDIPWQAMKQEDIEPLVAPPIYGCWQAARHTVEIAPRASTPWLDELNLDPRHRAVAAFGTGVIQSQQEELMASAWEQLGEIERINQIRRVAQLGRAVNGVYHTKHFSRFSAETLLKVTASAQSRLVLVSTGASNIQTRIMLSQVISRSVLPASAVSAPFRRLTSPRRAISTRFLPAGAAAIPILAKLNTRPIVQLLKGEAGLVTINQVSDRMGGDSKQDVRFENASRALDTAPQLAHFKISSEGDERALLTALTGFSDMFALVSDSPEAKAFRLAAKAHQDYINQKVFLTIWGNCPFVFSGGNGGIYAVDPEGRLLFSPDTMRDGTDIVREPSVIGPGGWQHFKFVFSGGNGIIYSVDPEGRLLFWRDTARDGTGIIQGPLVIGKGGWQNLRHLFPGGDGILYAVDHEGRLLFYRDKTQDGTGDVANPAVIGNGGWQNFRFLFSCGKGIIYAVDQEGRLLFYRDKTQDGTGNVANPLGIGPGGWHDFKFLFPGGGGILYAVDRVGGLLSSRDATQDGTVQIALPSVTGSGGKSFLAAPINLSEIKEKLLRSVDPEKTIKIRVNASLELAPGIGNADDPLEPILDSPDFPQPMYEALRDLSQDTLFPGLENVPRDSVTLLQTNPKFVESFLVGLNAEMSRELLWRNYPTGQRGTCFRRFWDTSAGRDEPDIDPINKWGNLNLGQNARGGEQLVLLIRGELLRRYPNSVIYAVAAVRDGEHLALSLNPDAESHPLFRGTLKPDITFLGFGLTEKEALDDPGWFFVIQQQPTEPYFGLDIPDFKNPLKEPLTQWNDLSWGHMVTTEEELKALSHASAMTALPEIDKVAWGRNSAHQAFITLQRPVRVAIHASDMLLPAP